MFKKNGSNNIDNKGDWNINQKKFLTIKRILKMVNITIILVFSIIAAKYVFGV